MDKTLMLEQLINHYTNGNKAKFAAMIGIKPQLLSKWISRNTFDAEKIYRGCKSISSRWLLNGEGNFLRDGQNGNNTIETNGDYSPASMNGNVSVHSDANLADKVKYLEQLLAEKERLITVLMERK